MSDIQTIAGIVLLHTLWLVILSILVIRKY